MPKRSGRGAERPLPTHSKCCREAVGIVEEAGLRLVTTGVAGDDHYRLLVEAADGRRRHYNLSTSKRHAEAKLAAMRVVLQRFSRGTGGNR